MAGKLYIRKSASVGALRINLSKSGVGTSVGIKGFRVGTRPNGTRYVHAGRYGVYYREELGKADPDSDEKKTPPPNAWWRPSAGAAVFLWLAVIWIVLMVIGACLGGS